MGLLDLLKGWLEEELTLKLCSMQFASTLAVLPNLIVEPGGGDEKVPRCSSFLTSKTGRDIMDSPFLGLGSTIACRTRTSSGSLSSRELLCGAEIDDPLGLPCRAATYDQLAFLG